MKNFLLGVLFVLISSVLYAQPLNKLVLRKMSVNYKNNQYKVIDLPQQMMVNWYDTMGIEHNDDKLLLYIVNDTLFFDVPNNDTLVEALAYNQIEFIRIFNIGKIILKPIALVSTFFFTYGAAGTIALFGYALTSYRSSEGLVLVFGGLLVAAIDLPLFYISKALWEGSNMTYKTEKWKLNNR